MTGHIPVMVHEMLAALAPRDGGIYLDGTFGSGGYASAILEFLPLHAVGDRPRS